MHLPAGLLILIGYLLLVAMGNLFGLVQGIYMGSSQEFFTTLPGFILYVLPAYGLYKQKKWAWFTEIILSAIATLLGFLVLLVENPLLGGLAMIIHSAIITYLAQNTCKKLYFEPKGQA